MEITAMTVYIIEAIGTVDMTRVAIVNIATTRYVDIGIVDAVDIQRITEKAILYWVALIFHLRDMQYLLQQRYFRLLPECSQRKVSATELTEAIEELATWVANFSINEQDYNVLLRYFSFSLHRLKSYRVRFEQEKNTLSVSY